AGRELDPHPVAGPDAAAGELARRPRGLPQQLRVRQAVDRGAIRMARGRARGRGVDAHGRQSSRPRMSVTWTAAGEYTDIRYELSGDGIAKITIDRPEVRNAFRPETIVEISQALEAAREDPHVGVIVLTGEGPDAFCSGGDQRVRGDTGYVAAGAAV